MVEMMAALWVVTKAFQKVVKMVVLKVLQTVVKMAALLVVEKVDLLASLWVDLMVVQMDMTMVAWMDDQ